MRIISGKYGRRRFSVPKGLKLRPTTDLAKEALFGILQTLIDFEDIQMLDLFCGTGNIGIECLSRGAKEITLIDKQYKQINFVKSVIEELGEKDTCYTIVKDIQVFLKDPKSIIPDCSFDFIFADPPYNLPWLQDIPELVLQSNILKKGGLFVLEHPSDFDFSSHSNFIKHRKYSAVNFSLFQL